MRVYAKAIVAFLTAALGGLALVVTGNEGFADVSTNEWLVLGADVVVTTAAVWGIRNADSGVGVE